MKILLADSDRDLLNSYERLLRLNGHEVGEAFDGTRVFSLLKEEKWDILLMEDRLPRVGRKELAAQARENGVPIIVLIREGISVQQLLAEDLPEAYLSLPFLPEDLNGLIENVLEKKNSGGGFPCGELVVDRAGFCLKKGDTAGAEALPQPDFQGTGKDNTAVKETLPQPDSQGTGKDNTAGAEALPQPEASKTNGTEKAVTPIRLTCQEIDLLAALNAEENIHGKRARTMILALNEKLSRAGGKVKIAYEYGKGYRLIKET